MLRYIFSELGALLYIAFKLIRAGAWAPMLVFTAHVFLAHGVRAYHIWPSTDIPMHFAGGLAMALFISGLFTALPREEHRSSRLIVLEQILIVSLTASAAVFWEFAEFSLDRIFATNVQVSLANTMKDLAMGIAGACTFSLIRIRMLRTGLRPFIDVARVWVGERCKDEFTAPRRI